MYLLEEELKRKYGAGVSALAAEFMVRVRELDDLRRSLWKSEPRRDAKAAGSKSRCAGPG